MPLSDISREVETVLSRPLIQAALPYAAVLMAGPVMVLGMGATYGVSRYLYLLIDLPGLAIVGYCAVGTLLWAALPSVRRRELTVRWVGPVWPVSIATFVVSIMGVKLVYHGYALSMDEYMTRLQAEIFRSGQLFVVLPEAWRPFGRALYGPFVSYDQTTGVMASNYRPGMSVLYALFDTVGLGAYCSAFLNAGAVALVARTARQLFPRDDVAPFLAALLLATSQQALAASLTSYAMSAHLCLNLLWLTLFLNGSMRSHVAAALVGVATASLHQIHPHLFFALPFLLTLVRPLQLRVISVYAIIYIVGHAAVYAWDWISFDRVVASLTPPAVLLQGKGPATSVGIIELAAGMFAATGPGALATVGANLVRMVGWQSTALLPLLVFAVPSVRAERRLWPVVASVCFSLLPYPFLMSDQGHGWGYRYMHGLLGCLALLAVPGWQVVARGAQLTRTWIVGLLVVSPLVMIPVRAVQIEYFVAPYARATAMLKQSKADVVLTDSYRVLVGADIPRNSPLVLQKPITLDDKYLTAEQIVALCRRYSVEAPTPEQFKAMKLPVFDEPAAFLARAYAERNEALRQCRQ